MILLPVTSTAQPECGAFCTPSHTRSGTSKVLVTGTLARPGACGAATHGTTAAVAAMSNAREVARITCSLWVTKGGFYVELERTRMMVGVDRPCQRGYATSLCKPWLGQLRVDLV